MGLEDDRKELIINLLLCSQYTIYMQYIYNIYIYIYTVINWNRYLIITLKQDTVGKDKTFNEKMKCI